MYIAPNNRTIRFGHCTLDDGRGVLAAPDGTETVLRPKTLQLLHLMLDNAGRVVGRGEILDAVWPGIFVTDDSVTQCVAELRKAMGAAGPGLLRTMPRRGYVLQGPVMVDGPPAAPAAEAPPCPGIDGRPAVAVLPFRKDYRDRDEAYFADGIIEGIVHALSQLDTLYVISRGSSLAFAEVTTDARAAARELGARYVLYGGVRRAAGRLRITTELTDAESGTVLRSDRYDATEADLFAVQDRIAEHVVTAVAPRLHEQEVARALRKPPSNLSSYDLVLRALDAMKRLDHAAMERARMLLQEAIAADSDSALPHRYMGWWHSLRVAQGWEVEPGGAEAARQHAAAALARDGRDAFALALRGFLLGWMDREFAEARRLLDDAVAASPSCALAWSWGAALRGWLGEGEGAVAWAEKGLRLAPCDPFTFLHENILAQACYTAGDFRRATAFARLSLAANPHHLPNWRTLVASLAGSGRTEEARACATRMLQHDPGFTLAGFAVRTPLQGHVRAGFLDRLRQAGLPE